MPHRYPHKDLIKPSVTEIIHDCSATPALPQWAANSTIGYIKSHFELLDSMCVDEHFNNARFEHRRLSKEALDIGSEVHDLIEKMYTDKVIYEGSRDEVNNCIEAYIKFIHDHDVMVYLTEHTVYSDYWAGTLDMECDLDGVRTVLDFKTSKAIYRETMYPQIAAYWSETDAKQGGILRLDKETAEYELKLLKKGMLEKNLKIFNSMCNLYFVRHPRIAKSAGVPF